MKPIYKVRLVFFVLNFLVNTVYSVIFVLGEILLSLLGPIAPKEVQLSFFTLMFIKK